MVKYKYVVVILVYRNTEDVRELLQCMRKKLKDYKAIIVNNYFDDETKVIFEKIAEEYQCDFVNRENTGYGAGNNAGIGEALEKYAFDYLIISNPDIVIREFPEKALDAYPDGVYGPDIRNLQARKQNPMLYKNNRYAIKLLYQGLKNGNSLKLFSAKAIHKMQRILGEQRLMKSKPDNRIVYQIHGSFLIFSESVIRKIGKPYDENMFLFGEEGYLAYLLSEKKIKTFYCPEIQVLHKEDGSMKFRTDIDEKCLESSLYFFEKYYFRKE